MGHVYILSNKAMPGLLKIGFTDRTPQQRAQDLYTTGTPAPFVVEFSVELSGNAYKIEQHIHRRLHEFRFDSQREFFRIELPDAVQHVAAFIIEGNHSVLNLHGKYSDPFPQAHEHAESWREIVTETHESKQRTAEAKRIIELRNEYKKWREEHSRITKNDLLTIVTLLIYPLPLGWMGGFAAVDLAERFGFLSSKVEYGIGHRGAQGTVWFFAGLLLTIIIGFMFIVLSKVKSNWGQIAPDKFKEVSD